MRIYADTTTFTAADRRQIMELAFEPFFVALADQPWRDELNDATMEFVADADVTDDDEKLAQQHAAVEVMVREYHAELRAWMERKLHLAESEQRDEEHARRKMIDSQRNGGGIR